ncbi:LCP family protein [Candidatus Peregrinibacteria bacterium]|nr:LCP family protein [Candidatus Peregrinibacteria bacterium]
MNFNIKKIKSKEPGKTDFPEPATTGFYHGKKFSISLSFSASIILIILLLVGIFKAVTSIDFKIFLKVAGDELQIDGYGHSNFLILGTGDKTYDGGNLTDSIIVASLDDENKLITMTSIPRDLYVQDEKIGDSRINEVYFNAKTSLGSSNEGLNYLREKVEIIMGIPIHYWLKVDFTGFKELVDAIGGIDISVEQAIYDPNYPQDNSYGYQTFSLPAGQRHMDGATALKYARSRSTTSDFDRAKRQQQIIYAMKEKALQTETIIDTNRINSILQTLRENIETNITVKEILTLGSIAGDYSPEQISHRLIHDDPTQCGGFLYPPVRELYGGMAILLPAGGSEFIHLYSDLTFNTPQIAKENLRLQILNGTKRAGIAGETKQILQRFCLNVARYGNGARQDIEQTTYYYSPNKNDDRKDDRPETLNFLQKIIPGVESVVIPPEYQEYIQTADIILEIGKDYTDSPKYMTDPFNMIFAMPAVASEAVASEASNLSPSPSPQQ